MTKRISGLIAVIAACGAGMGATLSLLHGDANRGKALFREWNCNVCHSLTQAPSYADGAVSAADHFQLCIGCFRTLSGDGRAATKLSRELEEPSWRHR